MQATQGNERKKFKINFNIGQNLKDQLKKMPQAKGKQVNVKKECREDSVASESSN